ncbi:MAG: nucleotidyltransferase domain-containing protein [candidate division WOR-3 bacterium]|nr:nucleotidyltransferase domain-containing protein [candidate division WOR-3 bacterium]
MGPQVVIDRARLAEFCRRHHIRKLSFFGSVLGESFRPDSDVDVLVEFEPEHVPGLLTLAGLEIELSGLLGRKADVRTAEDLSRYFRDEVVAKAQLLYAAA